MSNREEKRKGTPLSNGTPDVSVFWGYVNSITVTDTGHVTPKKYMHDLIHIYVYIYVTSSIYVYIYIYIYGFKARRLQGAPDVSAEMIDAQVQKLIALKKKETQTQRRGGGLSERGRKKEKGKACGGRSGEEGEGEEEEDEEGGVAGGLRVGDYAKVYGSSRCVGVLGGDAGGGGPRQEMQRIDIGATPDIEVREALLRGEPFVLTGLDVGACVAKWSARYLHSVAAHKQLAAEQLPAVLPALLPIVLPPTSLPILLPILLPTGTCTAWQRTSSSLQVCMCARARPSTWPGIAAQARGRTSTSQRCPSASSCRCGRSC